MWFRAVTLYSEAHINEGERDGRTLAGKLIDFKYSAQDFSGAASQFVWNALKEDNSHHLAFHLGSSTFLPAAQRNHPSSGTSSPPLHLL